MSTLYARVRMQTCVRAPTEDCSRVIDRRTRDQLAPEKSTALRASTADTNVAASQNVKKPGRRRVMLEPVDNDDDNDDVVGQKRRLQKPATSHCHLANHVWLSEISSWCCESSRHDGGDDDDSDVGSD